jgi:hypothetical protein
MSDKKRSRKLWSVLLAALLVLPGGVLAQSPENAPSKAFSREQLDQLLAPIALYPDSLLTQILMASTYPLEVAKANNWVKANKELKGDALAKALEKQEWDPSVKSMVNFPQVLQMMNDKLDWTQKLGDAFLAQQKDVLATVQTLRAKALEAGNLKTTKDQKVVVEQNPQIILIQQADPQVVYVPAYNPTVVYGVWAYPAYPPYPVYPPGYAVGAVAIGVAWGYAWGSCNYHGGDVNINYNQNTNINHNIDRGKYAQQQPGQGGQSGSGKWQHDASHRQGVAYRDSATAKQYGQGTGRQAPSNSAARGYGDRGGAAPQAGSLDRGAQGGTRQAGGTGGGGRENAFSGAGSGSQDRAASDRGSASRASGGGGGGGRGGGGGGGRSGGGGRGGGRR